MSVYYIVVLVRRCKGNNNCTSCEKSIANPFPVAKMDVSSLGTLYKEIVFRSRLEARWAMFFDLIKLKWYYEPFIFELSTQQTYRPDFYVDRVGFFEIKPSYKMFQKNQKKYQVFASEISQLILENKFNNHYPATFPTDAIVNSVQKEKIVFRYFLACADSPRDEGKHCIMQMLDDTNVVRKLLFINCPTCNQIQLALNLEKNIIYSTCNHKWKYNEEQREIVIGAFSKAKRHEFSSAQLFIEMLFNHQPEDESENNILPFSRPKDLDSS